MDTAQNLNPNPFFKAHNAVKSALSYAIEWRTIVIWIACAVLATYSGPFGTYMNYSSTELFATWLLLIGVAIITAYIVYEFCETFLPNVPPLVCNLVFFVVGSIAIGLNVHLVLANVLGHSEPSKPTLGLLILYSFAIMCFVQIVRKVLLHGTENKASISSGKSQIDAVSPVHSRLAQRLDIPKVARIDRVSANGHFIEVFTADKQYKTRMRFSDAIAELDESLGLSVHRSHWVHREAIKGWVPNAKKPYVLLENDMRVPVSKTNHANVVKAGIVELKEVEQAS